MEQNLNQNENIFNSNEQFDANRFKQDVQNLQQYQTSSNNNDATVVTVQVPVAVPVQVPVPIQVPVAVPVEVPVAVPVYVPVPTEQLEQMKQEQQQQDVNSTFNDTDTTVSNLGKEDAQNIENELNIKPKNWQDTTLSEASRDSVDLNTNTEPVDLSIDTSKITELASSAFSGVINTVKSLLPTSSTETKKEEDVDHKPESAVFEQAKQPLMPQPLEEEDKQLVEHTEVQSTSWKESASSTLNTDKDKTTESSFDQVKQPLMAQPLEKEDIKSTCKDDIIGQQSSSLDNVTEWNNIKGEREQKSDKREELIPLLTKDNNDYKWNNNETRSYADVAGDENKMIAGDTKANKDVSNIQLNTLNMDSNTLSSSTLKNRDENGQLMATEQIIPSQNDVAPQINDAFA